MILNELKTCLPSGIVVLFKPKGESSRTTLNRLQRALRSRHKRLLERLQNDTDLLAELNRRRPLRVGHAGTLDPLAEGVLVACVGEATKLIEVIQMLPKRYAGTFRLGETSDTEDIEGTVVALTNPPRPTHHALQEAASRMTGRIRQRPPSYSALKIAGKRAYQLARQGEPVTLAAREIEIYRIELAEYDYPEFRLDIECGSGTYVRSIGRDLGETVGSGAVMTALIRERIGPFTLTDALPPDVFDDPESEDWLEHLRPPESATAHLPRIHLDEQTAARLLRGQIVRTGEIPKPRAVPGEISTAERKLCAAFSPENRLVSLLEFPGGDQVRIVKNFPLNGT